MSFLYPEYLAFIFPLLIFLYRSLYIRRVTLHVAILILLLLALSRPVLQSQEQQTEIEGRDIVIALDISYSMRAKDIKPSRYIYAKEVIKEFLSQNPNDNVMLLAFTTNPLLLSPPTTDHQLILTALESLNLDYILAKGTSLSRLFEKLQTIGIEQKDMILMTDGGEEQNLDILVDMMRYKTKSFNILALGDSSGSSIENEDGLLLKDAEGNLVISRINPLLKELSNSLNGSYTLAVDSSTQTAKQLSEKILDGDEKFNKKEHKYFELYQVPLFLAAILFLIMHTKAVKYLVIFLGFFSLHVEASLVDNYYLDSSYGSYNNAQYDKTLKSLKQIKESSLESEVLKASSLYKLGEYAQALKIYMSIKSTSPKIKKQLYYNTANAYAKLGRYSYARVFYAKALQLGRDEDAEFNLKMIAFKVDEEPLKSVKTMPKSQENSSSNADMTLDDKKQKSKKTNSKVQDSKQKYPISSKTYELINKGYIDEKKPW